MQKHLAKTRKDKVVFIHEGKLNENKGLQYLLFPFVYLLSQQDHLRLRRLISDGTCLQADNGLIDQVMFPILGAGSWHRMQSWAQCMSHWIFISNAHDSPNNLYFRWTAVLEQKAEKSIDWSNLLMVDCSIDWKWPSIYTQNYKCHCDLFSFFWYFLYCHFSFISFINVLF